MYYVAKTMEIAGAHSLHLSYESKCEKLHGHNWIITVYCKAKELNQDGMVCDPNVIKPKFKRVVEIRLFTKSMILKMKILTDESK